MYKCVCGREFDHYKSFNGHRSHCKVHLGQQRFDEIESRRQEVYETRKEQELQQWVSEQHRCEYCGKVMTEKYASGRFCSRSCSNGWVSKSQSDDAKKRKIEIGKSNLVHDRLLGCCVPGWWTEERKSSLAVRYDPELGRRISKSLIEYYKTHSVSPETRQKISVALKKAIERGRRPGYLSLERSESYPERFWSQVLDNNQIPYEREFKVKKSDIGVNEHGCYFLDFLLPGNVDLEIDGSQHYGERQRLHDEKRTEHLESAGYVVYRIRWRNPNIHADIVSQDITDFLSWYRGL